MDSSPPATLGLEGSGAQPVARLNNSNTEK